MKIRDLLGPNPPGDSGPTSRTEAPAQEIPALSDEHLARAMAGVEQPKTAPTGAQKEGPNQLLTLQGDQIRERQMIGHPVTLEGSRAEKPIHFRDLSGVAQHLVRQLEQTGWVRVRRVSPSVLIELSKFFSREIGVLQSAEDGKLRLVLGTANGILKRQVRPGETVITHTHPVNVSKTDHFITDFRPDNAGKHMEAVIDWGGMITYLQDGRILNQVDQYGYVREMENFRAPFMDRNGDIVGYKTFLDDDRPDHKRRRQ